MEQATQAILQLSPTDEMAILAQKITNGEPMKTTHDLTSALLSEQTDTPTLLKLRWLAQSYNYNLFPDTNGASALDLSDRWNGQESLQAILQQLPSQSGNTSSPLQDFVFNILPMLQTQRAFLNSATIQNEAMAEQLLQLCLNNIGQQEENLRHYPAPQFYFHFLHLAKAELFFKAGQRSASFQLLNQMEESNSVFGTLAALKKIDMVAAPLSSPLVWNRAIQTNMAAANDLSWQTEEAEIFGLPAISLEKALPAYQSLEAHYDASTDTLGRTHLLLRYTYIHYFFGAYSMALEYAKQAMQLARPAHPFLFYLAQTQCLLINVALGRRFVPNNKLTGIAEWGCNTGSFSFALGLGIFITRMGRHWLLQKGGVDQALTCFRMAGFLFHQLGAKTAEAQSQFDQGQLYEAIGDINAATNHYEQGLEVFEQVINDPKSKIRKDVYRLHMMAANGLLSLYIKKMEGKAIQQTVTRIEKLLQQNISALPAFNENEAMDGMIHVFTQQSLEQGRIYAPLYLAVEARDEGNPTTAQPLFQQTRQEIERAASSNQPLYRGILAGHLKQFAEAKIHFLNYLNQGSGLGNMLTSLFQMAGEERYQSELLKQDQRSLELAFTFMVRTKHYEDALRYAHQLESGFGPHWYATQERPWETLTDYGEMHEGLQQYTHAFDYFDRAIDELEERRANLSSDEMKSAIGTGKGIRYLYFYAARAALQAGLPEKGLQYIERNKARALIDLVTDNQVRTYSKDDGIRQKWQGQQAQMALLKNLLAQARRQQQPDQGRITGLQHKIANLQHQLNNLEAQLPDRQQRFFNTAAQQSVSIDDISKSLSGNTLLVSYFLLSESLLIWAIDHTGLRKALHLTDIDDKGINRVISQFHQACQQRKNIWRELSQKLSDQLLQPIAPLLTSYDHLLIVPQGRMHKLPFQALLWEGQPLFQRFQISTLPACSLTTLLQPSKSERPPSVLAIGNPANMSYRPDFSEEEAAAYDPLYGAEIEASYVADQFSGSTLLLGEAATQEEVLKHIARHPLLLFATHGILSESAPLNSSILLSNGDALSLYELMGLDLDADLVALSACETALGEITGGDDVIGLSRGLFAAGARATLVSLWPVPDLTTSLFMTSFFERYKKTGSFSSALQQTQKYIYSLDAGGAQKAFVEVEKGVDRMIVEQNIAIGAETRGRLKAGATAAQSVDYSHPYYWGAFQLVGVG